MKVKVQVVIESDGGTTETVENIVCLERGALRPEDLGLTLAETKALLKGCSIPWSNGKLRSTWSNKPIAPKGTT